MAIFDVTLKKLKFANVDGFSRDFGTKKSRTQNGGSLLTRECNENVAMAFDTQRPFVVSENSSTGNIEYDVKFVIYEGITISLGVPTYDGCEVRCIALGDCQVQYESSTGITSTEIPKGSVLSLFSAYGIWLETQYIPIVKSEAVYGAVWN